MGKKRRRSPKVDVNQRLLLKNLKNPSVLMSGQGSSETKPADVECDYDSDVTEDLEEKEEV